MECQYCRNNCVKAGKQQNGKQKYRCKGCHKYQQGTPLSKPNNFKYNGGVEFNSDFDFNTYETLFRGYDPQLGRFMQIDPLADFMPGINPYQYAFNNPILYNDPFGLSPEDRKKRRQARRERKQARKNERAQRF